MILAIDVETRVHFGEGGRIDGSPFNPDNYLVSVGAVWVKDGMTEDDVVYEYFNHNDLPDDHSQRDSFDRINSMIKEASVVVAHNAKFDVLWLKHANFDIQDKRIYCTQIAEYLMLRGQKAPLSLHEVSIRRDVYRKKKDLTSDMFANGIGYEAMPMDAVTEYGVADCLACAYVFLSQRSDFLKPDNQSLRAPRNMMNEFLWVLVEMETNGIYIDLDLLDEVEQEFSKEKEQLESRLYEICREVMGDVPVNLNSPAQLSQVVYSRSIDNRKVWAETFNIGKDSIGRNLRRPRMTEKEFRNEIKRNTTVLYRQTGTSCDTCFGAGKVRKVKKTGEPYKNLSKCTDCDGQGMTFVAQDKIAGLKLSAPDIQYVSANGFVTKKDSVPTLLAQARKRNNPLAVEFLESMMRLNAVSTYLSSFCNGIKRNTRENRLLHTTFNQTVTATGRLSSSDPNFQNQPRGGTFPVRKCVVSRFEGGEILEADFSGLEFRVAGQLSKDPQIIADILEGKDVHKQTAGIINRKPEAEVTKDERQQAKAYTFAPLYGGQGATEPPHIKAYFEQYFDIYQGLADWHDTLREKVIQTTKVTLPSGRELAWPNVQRQSNGRVSFATQIVNYPVQSFATADIVPLACIRAYNALKQTDLKSRLILTVHDSIVMDIYPGELDRVKDILVVAMEGVDQELKDRYDYDMVLPLAIEIKSGGNWINGEVIYE